MPATDWGAWLPDQPNAGPPVHLLQASGVLPELNAYAPFPGLVQTTDALDDTARGLFAARDNDNVGRLFAGDSTKLYQLNGTSWEDYSKSGGYGPATSQTRWRFAPFGDWLIATNGIDAIQYLDMSGGATEFADLAGAPPTAEFVATYGEFLFLAVLGTNALTIKWSGIGNSENWTAGTGMSDEQEFADGGRITGLGVSYSSLYVFQEKCIRRVSFVGGDVIMQIDKIVEGIGCAEPNSLVQHGQSFYFLSEDGFYHFDGVSAPQPITDEKFDRWFLEDSNRSYWHTMSAAVDPRRKTVVWSYASTSSGAGTPDTLLTYNYAVGKGSYSRVEAEILASATSLGVSPDDLTDYVPDDHSDIGPDDPFWLGGSLYLACIDTDHKLASFSGANLEATFTTSPQPLFEGRRGSVLWIKPLTDAADATCAGGSQVKASDAIIYQTQVSQQASGRCPQRGVNGFFLNARVVIPAGSTWTYARGIEWEARQAGMR